MANEFIIKNGFYSNGNSAITGSLIVSASGTGNDLQVGTNKLVVSASGNVGIGTTNPAWKFTIQDSGGDAVRINVPDNTKFNRIFFQKPSQMWSVGSIANTNDFVIADETAVAYPFRIFSGSSNVQINPNGTGSVSIGTTVSSAKLHINNTTTQNSFLVEDETNPDTTPFVINTSGSVGIGTLSPKSLLHIKPLAPATSGQSGIVIEANAGAGINLISDNYNTNQSVTTFGRLQSSMAAFLAYAVNQTGSNISEYQSSQDAFATKPTALELGNGYFALKYNTSSISRTYGTNVPMLTSLYLDGSSGRIGIGTQTPQAIFHISSSGYGNETYPFIVGFNQFVVSASGNVGIGTTAPTSRLSVIGNIDLTSSTSTAINIQSGVGVRTYIASDGGGTCIGSLSNHAVYFNQNSVERARIDVGGNFGIGTTTPNAKLDVNGNTIITGSLTVTNDFILLGSASIQYITSSQLNIADNLITVNTVSPSIKFGGIAVIDSGSSPQRSGSLLFNSDQDEWIFVHQAGSGPLTSSLLLMGPETYNAQGAETHPTTNRIMKSLKDEHIGDSNISDDGSIVSINSNTQITGSLLVTGSLTAKDASAAINTTTSAVTTLKIHATPQQYTTLSIQNTKNSATGIDINIGGTGFGSNNNGIKTVVSGATAVNYGADFQAYDSPLNIGMSTIAAGPTENIGIVTAVTGTIGSVNYAAQLQDGTEAAGKVLVSQTSDGKSNWSTQLSGSYGLTGSLSISGSSSSYLLELKSSTTGNSSGGTAMQQLINAEPNRFSIRATTAGGNNANSTTFNRWASDHIIEYVSGSAIAPSKLKGWSWSYYNVSDTFPFTGYYQDILLISTSNEATLNASLDVNGNTIITGSLTVTDKIKGTSSHIDTNALIQASLLYLSNNF